MNGSQEMNLKLITDFDELEANVHQWNQVAQNARLPFGRLTSGEPKAFPFHSWAWSSNWFRHLGAEMQPYVLVSIDEAGRWTGIAPLCIDTSGFDTRLRWWGSGDACSDYLGPITREDDTEKFSLAFADWLASEAKTSGSLANVDVIELEGGTSEFVADKFLNEALDAVGFQLHTTELEGCWVVDLPAQWEELDRSFSKSMRRKTKKAVKRIGDESTTIRTTRDFSLDQLWLDFVDLHQSRRLSLGQPGCFAKPEFEAFLRGATESLIESGQAELIVIDCDGSPLAAMLLFNDGHTNYMYQSGADVTRMKQEPGYQIACHAIVSSIDQGFKSFDFLRGDEPYKSRWGTRRIAMLRNRWVPRKFTSVFKHNLWLTGRSLRSFFRKTK